MTFEELSVCGSFTTQNMVSFELEEELLSRYNFEERLGSKSKRERSFSTGSFGSVGSEDCLVYKKPRRESQVKLGQLYNLISKADYGRKDPRYSNNTLEMCLSDVILCEKEMRSQEMQFDSVCAILSKDTNNFLAETYVKSLIGKFPYNLTKRKRKTKKNENKSRFFE